MRGGGKQKDVPSQRANGKDWAWLAPAEWGLAVLLTGITIFFHFTFFTHVGGLWRDEVHSLQLASRPSLSSTFEYLRYDSFPLLSTLVLRSWIHAGLSADHSLRVFGFLVGASLLGALWLTCRVLRCPTPLISLALVGLNPWVVRTTDSIRPYGLGIALIVVTLGCVWKAVETSKRAWFILAGLLAVLSVQCMYQNAFLLLSICLGGVFVCLRDSRIRTAMGVVLVGLAAAVSLIPYLPSIAVAQTWGVLVRTPVSMQHLFEIFFQTLGSGSIATLWLWFALGILSGAVGIQALLSRRRQAAARARSNLALYCATVLAMAVVAYLIAMKASQLVTQPWYFVPLAVLVAPTLDATAWLAATTNWRNVVRFAVVLAIACTLAISGWRQLYIRWTDVDVIAGKVAEKVTAEDIIVLSPFWIGTPFQRYYKGPARWVTVPPLEEVQITRFDLVKAAMARNDPLEPVFESMVRTLHSGHRVFFVQGLPITFGPPPALPPAPLPDTGWDIGPYVFGWTLQTMDCLNSHGLRTELIYDTEGGPLAGYEDVSVTIVSGWRR